MARRVTFVQAKKFKEKGFDKPVTSIYDGEGNVYEYKSKNTNLDKTVYSAPEHWQVVDWLLEKHGIWVSVDPCMTMNSDTSLVEGSFSFMYAIKNGTEELFLKSYQKSLLFKKGYEKPHEAYSAAFDYILENLI